MILHIPHSSDVIPENLRDQIVLSDDDLAIELILMTDAFTDELFALPESTTVKFPISRLLVDVERFQDDADEPMSKKGMGMIYALTSDGKKLKRTLQADEKSKLVARYYDTHHQLLLKEVKDEMEQHGKALIVDCHSFPNRPLMSDSNKDIPRPQFCIGADSFHAPALLLHTVEYLIKGMGFSVGINWPYAGSIVPKDYYMKDSRATSIIIEVNRSLYMDELSGIKTDGFDKIKEQIQSILYSIKQFQ